MDHVRAAVEQLSGMRILMPHESWAFAFYKSTPFLSTYLPQGHGILTSGMRRSQTPTSFCQLICRKGTFRSQNRRLFHGNLVD
jgi:hypothetical protein